MRNSSLVLSIIPQLSVVATGHSSPKLSKVLAFTSDASNKQHRKQKMEWIWERAVVCSSVALGLSFLTTNWKGILSLWLNLIMLTAGPRNVLPTISAGHWYIQQAKRWWKVTTPDPSGEHIWTNKAVYTAALIKANLTHVCWITEEFVCGNATKPLYSFCQSNY